MHNRLSRRRPHLHCLGFTRLPLFGLLLVAGLLNTAAPVEAQSGNASQPEALAGFRPADALATQYVMLAKQTIAVQPLTASHMAVARGLLDLALERTPDDPELMRLWLELTERQLDGMTVDAEYNAMWGSPVTQEQRVVLERLVRVDPGDERSLARLLRATADQEQNLRARIERLAGMLDSDAGRALSLPVRSYLQSYLAFLCFEMGDDQAAGRWVDSALDLDPTNWRAAIMLDQVINQALASGDADPAAIGVQLIRLVQADPVSPEPRLRVALAFLEQAVFNRAMQQFEMHATLTGRPLNLRLLVPATVALHGADRTPEAVGSIGQLQSTLAQADPPQPMPSDLHLLRLAMIWRSDAERSEPWLEAYIQQRGDSPEAVAELAWALAVFAQDPSRAEPYIQRLSEIDPANTPTPPDVQTQDEAGAANAEGDATDAEQAGLQTVDEVQPMLGLPLEALSLRARGWLAMRQGDQENATALLTQAAREFDDPMAFIGLAMMREPEQSKGFLQRLIQRQPIGLAAVIAVSELRRLGGEPEPSPGGERLIAAANRLPVRLWTGDPATRSWTQVRLTVDPTRSHYLQPLTGTMRITNSMTMQMGVRPGGAMPTNALIMPQVSLDGDPTQIGQVEPIYVDLRRVLSLGPNQTIEVPFRVDWSAFGVVASDHPGKLITFTLRAITNPVLVQGDPENGNSAPVGFTPGPLGALAVARNLFRVGQPINAESVQADLATLQNPGSEAAWRVAIARLLTLDRAETTVLPRQEATSLRRLINDGYANWTPERRAWTACFIPSGDVGNARYGNALTAAARSDELATRAVYLIRFNDHADHRATLGQMLRSDDAPTRDYAQAVSDFMDASE